MTRRRQGRNVFHELRRTRFRHAASASSTVRALLDIPRFQHRRAANADGGGGLADVRPDPQSARPRAGRTDPIRAGRAVRAGGGPRRRPLRPPPNHQHLPARRRACRRDARARHRGRLDDAGIAAGRRVRHRLGPRLRADHALHAAAGHRADVAAGARHRGRRLGDAGRGDRRAGAWAGCSMP